jgi:hypothetical protein
MFKLDKLRIIKQLYSLYCLLSYLLLPFVTIPIGALIFWICSGSLPAIDIEIISLGITPLMAALLTSFIIAPIYYFFVVFVRSEMNLNSQIILHLSFIIANLTLLFFINYDLQVGLSPYFLSMLPQLLILHVIHVVWVNKFRDFSFKQFQQQL